METQLFDIAGGWDQGDTMCFNFYDCTSKIQLGNFPAGTFFASVWFDYQAGTLTVYKDNDQQEISGEFKLKLVVE